MLVSHYPRHTRVSVGDDVNVPYSSVIRKDVLQIALSRDGIQVENAQTFVLRRRFVRRKTRTTTEEKEEEKGWDIGVHSYTKMSQILISPKYNQET